VSDLTIKLADDILVVAPASLSSITTYVLLEQERWFEKEIDFLRHWLGPGMNALDIGANIGVYGLPIARMVGPEGRVVAYEPSATSHERLTRGRDINRLHNLEVIDAALSDGERLGRLSVAWSNELNSLSGEAQGETVRITSLDAEDARHGWPPLDFVKIDAEGEEERILRGGAAFFARHSPLVMFEVTSAKTANLGLSSVFSAMGYNTYRLLAGAPILVPHHPAERLDAYELNLFAAKPDRAASLAASGLLCEKPADWRGGDGVEPDPFALLRRQSFAASCLFLLQAPAALDGDYRDALIAYAAWRSQCTPLGERCGALAFSCRKMAELCRRAGSPTRLSTLARVAAEAGARTLSVDALRHLVDHAKRGELRLAEAFWPACPRYDDVVPSAGLGDWFLAAAVEQLERSAGFSSLFAGCTPELEWLCRQSLASTEMQRRRALLARRAGRPIALSERLCRAGQDHLNAELWRSGRVLGLPVAPPLA